MTTQTKKTKKIKIVAIILSIVAIISTLLVALSLNTISHCMKINKPNQIIVYYNNETTNKAFEQGDEYYDIIYSSMLKSYEQSILSSLTTGKIFKDVKITKLENTSISFNGIKINFIYNNPQAVRYKNKLYYKNDETYWYQSLIFDIPNINRHRFNNVAIIPPQSSQDYISSYDYSLSYKAYSNFSTTYNIVENLFKK